MKNLWPLIQKNMPCSWNPLEREPSGQIIGGLYRGPVPASLSWGQPSPKSWEGRHNWVALSLTQCPFKTELIWCSQEPWARGAVSPLLQDNQGSVRWSNSSNVTWLWEADANLSSSVEGARSGMRHASESETGQASYWTAPREWAAFTCTACKLWEH